MHLALWQQERRLSPTKNTGCLYSSRPMNLQMSLTRHLCVKDKEMQRRLDRVDKAQAGGEKDMAGRQPDIDQVIMEPKLLHQSGTDR